MMLGQKVAVVSLAYNAESTLQKTYAERSWRACRYGYARTISCSITRC